MFQKILLTFILISAIFLNITEAQEQRFKAGVILGSNLSQIDGDNSNGYLKLGITGGLRGVAIITDKIELSIEFLFDQRGSRSQKIFDENFFPFKVTTNYVSVPIIFNFQDWLDESEEYYKLHFHAGLSYGRLINYAIDDEHDESILVEISKFFNEDEVAVLVGATFYTGKHLAITGRFTRSLTNLYDYSESDTDGRPPVRRPFLSKHLSIHLLYMF